MWCRGEPFPAQPSRRHASKVPSKGGYAAGVTPRRGKRQVHGAGVRGGFPFPRVVVRRAHVPVGRFADHQVVLVDDAQRPPVRGPLNPVTTEHGPDGVEAAELFGQLPHAPAFGGRDPPTHRPCRVLARFHAAKVRRTSCTARRDSPVVVVVVRSKLRCSRRSCFRAS